MKTNELNDWLGVITNIGIIIGLARVGYEVHQNNIELERESRASEIEVLSGIREAWQNWGMTFIENAEVADIWVRGNAERKQTSPTWLVSFSWRFGGGGTRWLQCAFCDNLS